MSLCSLSRRLSLSTLYTRCRVSPFDHILSKRRISSLSISNLHNTHTTHSNQHKYRTFCSNSSGDNNNTNSKNKPNESVNTRSSASNIRIYNEARSQKSLVKATGKNKSLVPYIGSVLVVPIQKPLFPGFASVLCIKDEALKTHFIQLYRKRLEALYDKNSKIENGKDIVNSTEWIGLFLNNPKTTPINAEEELEIEKNNSECKETETQTTANTEDTTKSTIVWHPALDEVNSDMHHFVESMPKQMDDIFNYGVLAKIDYEDESTNISGFIRIENEANGITATETVIDTDETDKKSSSSSSSKKPAKGIAFPVSRKEDPLVLKVISARRIKIDSMISYDEGLIHGNIQHLQPSVDIKITDNVNGIDVEVINESANEIRMRSAFNVASDLLRRLYYNDPDQRREMLQLWSARHHIDIGFFCDFAASITNSTPRELQQLLQNVDYGERLELLCRLLRREEEMMKKRDEILNNVDSLMKKEDESNYLKMILATTQRRLLMNHREKNAFNGANGYNNRPTQQQQTTEQSGGGMESGVEEKKDRFQRLAVKFKERMNGKKMSVEAQEVFDEGIEKLISAKNRESLDIETTKQYLDWISSMPWNTYSIDNDNIKKARDILDETHYGMKLVKQRILEVIACNILRGDMIHMNDNSDHSDHSDDSENNDKNTDNDDVNASKILCLIGPPGVGKTSIGSSIAKSLNRKFFKFSLGGSDDSHLLKGFLRTYAGSQPGKIIYGLKQCHTANPMILIDEIDKIGARHSDPSHALLEILDPSQNHSFSDNYLDFSVDLSKVLFVCTANDESKINPVLKDRLQIIHLNGYDEHEKLEIAKKYLIPNALKQCGLKVQNINLNDDVIGELIKWYSRESGVRSLAQLIDRICCKSALQLAEAGVTFNDIHNNNENNSTNDTDTDITSTSDEMDNAPNQKRKKILETLSGFVKRIALDNVHDDTKEDMDMDETHNNNSNNNHEIPFVSITKDNLKDYVGLRKYENDRTYIDDKSTPSGVVTGLAYTTAGGCITYVETIKYKKTSNGDGVSNIKATGQLGKVMGESVEIAQCVARAILSNKIDANNRFFDEYSIHLHCPQGGIPKDGPSAGITMVTALLSLALNQGVSPNVAMTGECTLTGKILKIGGLREKLLAAKRAKIKTLILPYDNLDDFYDDEFGVPKYLREEFGDVHFVKSYDEVLDILFDQHLPSNDRNDCTQFDHIDLNHPAEMPKLM